MENKDLKDLSDEELNRFSKLLAAEHAKFQASNNKTLEESKAYTELFKEVLAELRKRKLK